MLLYPNDRLMPVIFGVGVAICSKVIFRAPVGDGKTQHIFNPSNLGIVATLLLFPSIGVAPPYHFTENLTGMWHWALPGFVLATGLIVHGLFTGRLTLVLTWLVAFIIQGQLRSWYFGTSWIVPLTPMTSAAFMVFTLYMIPDPATTPVKPLRQALFAIAPKSLISHSPLRLRAATIEPMDAVVVPIPIAGATDNQSRDLRRGRNDDESGHHHVAAASASGGDLLADRRIVRSVVATIRRTIDRT